MVTTYPVRPLERQSQDSVVTPALITGLAGGCRRHLMSCQLAVLEVVDSFSE